MCIPVGVKPDKDNPKHIKIRLQADAAGFCLALEMATCSSLHYYAN